MKVKFFVNHFATYEMWISQIVSDFEPVTSVLDTHLSKQRRPTRNNDEKQAKP